MVLTNGFLSAQKHLVLILEDNLTNVDMSKAKELTYLETTLAGMQKTNAWLRLALLQCIVKRRVGESLHTLKIHRLEYILILQPR